MNFSQGFVLLVIIGYMACTESKTGNTSGQSLTDTASLVNREKYLVTIMSCSDCHSPKMMTANGPVPDPAKLLSGHLFDKPLSPFDSVTAKGWLLFDMGETVSKGPWGTSYAANLTPDETGIGNWSEEQFSNSFRKGFFKGLTGSRHLMPPMPWPNYAEVTDEDTQAIFLYMKSLPAVKNLVPPSVPAGM